MKLKPNLMLRKIGTQYIVVANTDNIDVSKVISLNSTAAFLWRQAEGKDFTTRQLTAAICAAYDVDPLEAFKDIEKTVEIWKENGLIEPEKEQTEEEQRQEQQEE